MRHRIKMKEEYGNYQKGETLNLPKEAAEDLVKKGVAVKMAEIGYEKKVVFVPENKDSENKPSEKKK